MWGCFNLIPSDASPDIDDVVFNYKSHYYYDTEH